MGEIEGQYGSSEDSKRLALTRELVFLYYSLYLQKL
jgi:hypothetical protein